MTPSPPAAAWQPFWRQLVEAIVRVDSAGEQEQMIARLATPHAVRVVGFVNAHAMNSVVRSPEFFRSIRSADLLLRDGIGMAILMRLLKLPPGLNLNGTDLIPRIIGRFAGARIALFGTEEPYLSRARDVVQSRLAPGSRCITEHGFHEDHVYVSAAGRHRPTLIVLGMGMPRQEAVAVALRDTLGSPCLIVCGGAIVDFLGERHRRAPGWMRHTGLEWLFRLLREPRRLFSRYVVGNPVFLARAVSLAARGRQPASTPSP
jgi:N-acetylglucosaminyldiphosphoundecaprenol N-acetyl-beta-D-mannosaminyltransferase